MPVKFICPHCETLLRVTRRKIGVSVECPTCSEPCVVPEQQAAAASVARTTGARQRRLAPDDALASQPTVKSGSGVLDVFESLDDLLPAEKSARPATPARVSSAQSPHFGRLSAETEAFVPPLTTGRGGGRSKAIAGDLVVIPRRAVYFQAACIPLLLAIGMTAGYFLGRSHTAPTPEDRGDAAKVQSIHSEERQRMDEWLFKDAA